MPEGRIPDNDAGVAQRLRPLRRRFGPAPHTVLSPGAARFLWRVYLNKESLSKRAVKIAHWAGVYRLDSRIVNRPTPSLAGANPWRARNVLSAVIMSLYNRPASRWPAPALRPSLAQIGRRVGGLAGHRRGTCARQLAA